MLGSWHASCSDCRNDATTQEATMHDIDRTQLELEQEGYELEYEQEHEQFVGGIVGGVSGGGGTAPLHEAQEMELAVELLEAANEHDFEQFLGDVFSSVGNSVGRLVRSDTGQALGGILKDAARQALPVVGRAVGERIAPGRGGEWGGRIAEAAGSLLGLELEGLSPQDQEFEAARQFVRFASAAAEHAALAPPTLSPQTVAHAAATAAAHRFAPGLAHELGPQRGRVARGGGVTRAAQRPAYGGVPRRAGSFGRPVQAQYRRSGPQAGLQHPSARMQRPRAYGSSGVRRPGAYAPSGLRRPAFPRPGMWRPAGYPRAGFRRPAGLPQAYRPPAGRPYGVGARPLQWRQWAPRLRRPAPARRWQYGVPAQYGVPGPGYGVTPLDWSQYRAFLGDAPPAAPPGAPGQWVYRGRRRGRRHWAWIPFPYAEPFWWPPTQVEWPADVDVDVGVDGGPPAGSEPFAFGPPPEAGGGFGAAEPGGGGEPPPAAPLGGEPQPPLSFGEPVAQNGGAPAPGGPAGAQGM
jgi:hypothetical protein